jgi:hypothetical protein
VDPTENQTPLPQYGQSATEEVQAEPSMPRDHSVPAATKDAPAKRGFDWRRLLSMRRVSAALAFVAAVGILAYVGFVESDDADLRVGHITPTTPFYPPGAVPYSLPYTALIIRTKTKITGCLEDGNAEVLHGTTDLEIVQSIEVDPHERYYLYFDSDTKSKNLDYAMETYENGTLKRLTASIKDQVAPITSATLGGLVGIFHGAAVAPAVAYPPGKANCTQIAAAIRQNPDDPRLRLQQEDRWTPTENSKFYVVKVALDQLRELFKLTNPRWSGWANARVTVSALRDSSTEDDSSIWGGPSQAAIKFPDVVCPDSKVDQHGKVDQQCPPSLVKGLVLRNAVRMTVSRSVCDAVCDQTPQHDQLTALNSFIEAFPQFGTHFLILVHSGFAQDAAVDVALSPDGLITYLKLQNTNALAGSIKEIGSQVGGLGAGAGTPNTSTTAANKSLADCLAAQKEVVSGGGTPIGAFR